MVCRFVGSCMVLYGEINMQIAKGNCLMCAGLGHQVQPAGNL